LPNGTNGTKDVLPSTHWKPLTDERTFEHLKHHIIHAFQALVAEQGGTTTMLEFAPEATDAEIMARFISSG
jgi:hypothetical protein